MSLKDNNLREKLVPGTQSEDPVDRVFGALEGAIDRNERIQYRLPGKGGVVREHDGGTDRFEPSSGGGSLAVVTDQKLLFAVDDGGESTIEVPHTDIKRVAARDGLLRSKLAVAVWGDGEYRFRIADASELGAAVEYLREASECWELVIATLDDAYERVAEMGERLEAGRLEEADTAREQANSRLDRARSYLNCADIDPPEALVERIEEAETEKHRTEIRTRISRAETMIADGTHRTENRAYTEACLNFRDARDHLETALSLAREADLPEPPEIDSKLDKIDTRLANLEVKPRALAEQACERATGTDSLTVEIEAWEEALGHYRDALTAGWGLDLGFSGETDELRMKTEIAVGELIDARRQLASRYETEADRQEGDAAMDRYAAAIEQLEEAHQLASEFRSGDQEAIWEDLNRLRGKRYRATQ